MTVFAKPAFALLLARALPNTIKLPPPRNYFTEDSTAAYFAEDGITPYFTES